MRIKKSKKIALVLSMSLGLMVPVWAEDPIKLDPVVDNSSETGTSANAEVRGLIPQANYPAGTSFEIIVKALGGTNSNYNDAVRVNSYGIFNDIPPGTITTGNNTITSTAVGGKDVFYAQQGEIRAFGIMNAGTLTTQNNTIVATARRSETDFGGTHDVIAYGIQNANQGTIATESNRITVTAITGRRSSSAGLHASASAYGILNLGRMTTGSNTIEVTAIGGEAEHTGSYLTGASSEVRAYGIQNNNILTTGVMTTGDNTITITVIGGKTLGTTTSSSMNIVEARGIWNMSSTLTTGNNKIIVTGTGGKGDSNTFKSYNYTKLHGIYNSGILKTESNTIEVTTIGGETEHMRRGEATACGIQNENSLTTGNNIITTIVTGGKVASTSASTDNKATAHGIDNSGTLSTGTNAIMAMSTGRESTSGNSGSSDYTRAYGIQNTNILNTEENMIIAMATGGKVASNSGTTDARVIAYGIVNSGAMMTIGNNTIVATATGGEDLSIDSASAAYVNAYGIQNTSSLSTEDNMITAMATGGEILANLNGDSSLDITAFGIQNSDTMNTKENTIRAIAIGGIAEGATTATETTAYGIQNMNSLSTEDNMITAMATGGKVASNSGTTDARATAYGISNDGTMSTKNNIVVATATGGHDSSTDSATDAYVRAYGISNSSTLTTEGNTITVTATGGEILANLNGDSSLDITAFGIQNSGTMNTKENTIRAIAIGGIAEGATATTETTAVGMYSKSNGNLTAVGSQNIYTEATSGTANGVSAGAYAYALLAESDGTIILDSRGEAVKLTGDIGVNGSGMITVSLDNADSIWRPRLQDTYGSAETGSFGSGSFTMRDGGVLDLAWHSNLNGYNFKGSQLNLTGDTIQIGDGATFIVNADLANDVADTISANTTATGTQYVRVAYDPSYLTYETVEGRALVLDFDGANGMGLASTVERPGSDVTFMPIMEGGYLVSLKRTVEPGIVGKVGSDSYHQQINILRTQWSNLVQRLGDVRNENPESHNGSWARIHGGKLKSDGAYNRKSTMKYGGVQAGYDRMRETGSGKYLAGFLVDYIDADSNFQRGEGNTQSLAFGGYWTWLSPKGHYADVVVKAAHLDTDYDFYYLSGEKASADFTNWGYTMSVEYGYRHDLKKNRYIEPQAQFLVGHLESKNYRSSNGVSLHQDGVNLAMGRLGVLMGWTDENKSSAYVRGSVVHDFSGSGVLTSSYEGDRMRIDTAGNTGTTFEVNVGANVIVGKNSHLYAELTKSFGGDVKTDWQANLGWRVKW